MQNTDYSICRHKHYVYTKELRVNIKVFTFKVLHAQLIAINLLKYFVIIPSDKKDKYRNPGAEIDIFDKRKHRMKPNN